jgi:hypothetical protein
LSDTPDPQEGPLRNIKNTPSIYSNFCLVRTTPEEVMLHFGLRSPEDPTQGDAILTVYTNLWHAKRLASALLESIAKYEAIFGELPKDPTVTLDPKILKELGVSDDHDN